MRVQFAYDVSNDVTSMSIPTLDQFSSGNQFSSCILPTITITCLTNPLFTINKHALTAVLIAQDSLLNISKAWTP